MSLWQAIIFDLDDTLYSERDYVLSGFGAVAEWGESHLRIPKEQGYSRLLQLYTDGVRGDTFNRWLLSFGLDDSSALRLVEVYRQHEPCIRPFPEVPALLFELRRHYRLGLLSDGYLGVQQRKLVALNLVNIFDVVLFTDELGREFWKPSPKPFREVLLRLDVQDPGQAIYVADNPLKDFFGAREVGVYTVWFRRPGGEYVHCVPPTEAHRPEKIIQDLSALPQLIAGLKPDEQ